MNHPGFTVPQPTSEEYRQGQGLKWSWLESAVRIVPAHVHSKHLSVLAVKLKTFLVVKSGCVFKSCKYLGVRKEILWNKLQTRSIPVGFFFRSVSPLKKNLLTSQSSIPPKVAQKKWWIWIVSLHFKSNDAWETSSVRFKFGVENLQKLFAIPAFPKDGT